MVENIGKKLQNITHIPSFLYLSLIESRNSPRAACTNPKANAPSPAASAAGLFSGLGLAGKADRRGPRKIGDFVGRGAVAEAKDVERTGTKPPAGTFPAISASKQGMQPIVDSRLVAISGKK